MSKIITSPVPEFPGTITLNSAPPPAKVERFLEAYFTPRGTTADERQVRNQTLFDTANALSEKWDIKGQPTENVARETLVGVPYMAVTELLQWLIGEVYDLCIGERIVPKVSEPEPTDTLAGHPAGENQPT